MKLKVSNKEKHRYLISRIERNISLLENLTVGGLDNADLVVCILDDKLNIACLPPELVRQEWRERLLDCGCIMSWPENIADPYDSEFSYLPIHVSGWKGKNGSGLDID